MDNPEKLATLGTQDKGRKQTKKNTQHRKLKRRTTRTSLKTTKDTQLANKGLDINITSILYHKKMCILHILNPNKTPLDS